MYSAVRIWVCGTASYTAVRLAITAFSRIFTGEGTLGYMGCPKSKERKGQRLDQWRRVAGVPVLYYNGSLKWLVVGMVSAEMLLRKPLLTRAAGIKNLYFTWGRPWQNSSQWLYEWTLLLFVKTRVTPCFFKTMILTRVIPWFCFFLFIALHSRSPPLPPERKTLGFIKP